MDLHSLSELLRKKHGLDPMWNVHSISVGSEDAPEGMIKVVGCNFKNYERGPKKGTPRIAGAKIDKQSQRTFFYPLEEYHAS